MKENTNRRKFIKHIGFGSLVTAFAPTALFAKYDAQNIFLQDQKDDSDFIFCLNMATIRGHNLDFIKELEVASAAGFRHVEIWFDKLQYYLNSGGTISNIKNKLSTLNLKIENCIAFDEWIVNDATARNANIENMKQTMQLLASVGCKRIAATAKGLTNDTTISLDTIAERYNVVLEAGLLIGVTPMLEMWGFQKQLSTVSEVTYCAMQTGNVSAKILLDVFHIYKGKSPVNTLSFINPEINDILHMNDYPATLSADVITDADRIYPGDGVAPIKQILKALKRRDQPLILSTELFNKDYYAQDADLVAKTSLNKMKAIVRNI